MSRPVHYATSFLDDHGLTPAVVVPFCMRRGVKTSVPPELTTDSTNTTCKRCQALLAALVRTKLKPPGVLVVHYHWPYTCNGDPGLGDAWTPNLGQVTCHDCFGSLAVLTKAKLKAPRSR